MYCACPAAGHVLQRLLQQRAVAAVPLRAAQHRLVAEDERAPRDAAAVAGVPGEEMLFSWRDEDRVAGLGVMYVLLLMIERGRPSRGGSMLVGCPGVKACLECI